MYAKTYAVELVGIEGQLVEVEAKLSRGLRTFKISGMAGQAVREAKERVLTAFKQNNIALPNLKIQINLAPAQLKKHSPTYDLAIVAALLKASNYNLNLPEKTVFWGEIGLTGEVKLGVGALALLDSLKNLNLTHAVIPIFNAHEAGIITGLKVKLIDNIMQLVNSNALKTSSSDNYYAKLRESPQANLLISIKGQSRAKRALTIAAAGNHNLLLIGSPGVGKSMLAGAITDLLPELTTTKRIATSKIYSICNKLPDNLLISKPPFRSPHHTTSLSSMIGGGNQLLPGEISLAHNGVLFLDEINLFKTQVLESLREPMENKAIELIRGGRHAKLPANFQLIAAMNPCKCGYALSKNRTCNCTPREVSTFQQKLSGPIMDRIDLQVIMNEVSYSQLQSKSDKDEHVYSGLIKQIAKVRKQKIEEVRGRSLEFDQKAEKTLAKAYDNLGLSPRALKKIKSLAETIALLDRRERIEKQDLEEALSFRLN